MPLSSTSPYDHSAKHDFDDVYDAGDPRAYVRALAPLDYRIPQHAHGVFCELAEARRLAAGGDAVTVTDLCCSYGINAALLKHTCTLEDLYQRYCSEKFEALSSDELAACDAGFYAERRRPSAPRVVGLDLAANAVSYALRAGLLDAGYSENLEEAEPSAALQRDLAGTDLVTVTGGVGYIGPSTFDRVLTHVASDRIPWVAAFVLRWVDYEPVAETLARHGLVTERLSGRTFPQRRFADDSERDFVLSTLADLGIDPDGKEAGGEHHTYFYLSRTPREAAQVPVDHWFAASGR